MNDDRRPRLLREARSLDVVEVISVLGCVTIEKHMLREGGLTLSLYVGAQSLI